MRPALANYPAALAIPLAVAAGVLATTPAAAHPGDHARMSLMELVTHYAEADHLAFLALTVIVGWLAYRAGRRVEARARVERQSEEQRP